MAIVKSGFHMRKHFCENYPQFGYAPSRSFATPISRKSLKNIGFKGHLIIILPGVRTCLGPALGVTFGLCQAQSWKCPLHVSKSDDSRAACNHPECLACRSDVHFKTSHITSCIVRCRLACTRRRS